MRVRRGSIFFFSCISNSKTEISRKVIKGLFFCPFFPGWRRNLGAAKERNRSFLALAVPATNKITTFRWKEVRSFILRTMHEFIPSHPVHGMAQTEPSRRIRKCKISHFFSFSPWVLAACFYESPQHVEGFSLTCFRRSIRRGERNPSET